jgi:hypothetical protein
MKRLFDHATIAVEHLRFEPAHASRAAPARSENKVLQRHVLVMRVEGQMVRQSIPIRSRGGSPERDARVG